MVLFLAVYLELQFPIQTGVGADRATRYATYLGNALLNCVRRFYIGTWPIRSQRDIVRDRKMLGLFHTVLVFCIYIWVDNILDASASIRIQV